MDEGSDATRVAVPHSAAMGEYAPFMATRRERSVFYYDNSSKEENRLYHLHGGPAHRYDGVAEADHRH